MKKYVLSFALFTPLFIMNSAFAYVNHNVNEVCSTFRAAAANPEPDVVKFKGWTTFYKGRVTSNGYAWHSSPNDLTPFYETGFITANFEKEITTDEKAAFFKQCGLMPEELFMGFYSIKSPGLSSVSAAIALGESGWFEGAYPDFITSPSKE